MINIFRNTFFLFLIIVALFLSYIFVPTIGKSHDDDKETHDLQQISQESMGVVGEVSLSDFDPTQYLTTSNFNHLSPQEREKFYQETPLADGTTLREYWITAEDKNIEIAPGVFFPAWTFNGQVPGPTLRATEGDPQGITLISSNGVIFDTEVDVAFDILNYLKKDRWLSIFTVTNVAGFLAGLFIMYFTGFLVLQ